MLSASVLSKGSRGDRPRSLALLLSVVFGLVGISICGADSQRETNASKSSATRAGEKAPWSRIVMIGASASAGFNESEPFGGPTTSKLRLNRYLDAALQTSHEPVR